MEKEGVATILEVFGDVVVALWLLQKLCEGIRGLFHQQGALYIHRGQRTPHNLQVLCPNMDAEREVDDKIQENLELCEIAQGNVSLSRVLWKCSPSVCCLKHDATHYSQPKGISWNETWNISTRSEG